MWEVEYTNEFGVWWDNLDGDGQEAIDAAVEKLAQYGPTLPFPISSAIVQSRHPHMRELRIQYKGRPLRVLYAFNPMRNAILLLGGDKQGDKRWYDEHVPRADVLYDIHLAELQREGKL